MELRHLRYFVLLARERHFGRAARRLHVVQSALSVQIKDLEEEIGETLFRRTSRNVELSASGVEFLKHAEAILKSADEAKQYAQMAGRGEIGFVRIGFSASAFLDGNLSAVLRRYHTLYPRVQITLQECSPAEQAQALLEKRLDLCLAPNFSVRQFVGIETATLCRWPWSVALGAHHALAKVGPITPQVLRDEVFIRLETAGVDSAMVSLLGFEPQRNRRVSGILAGLTMIASGLGIAFLPACFAQFGFVGICYRDYPSASTIALQLLSRHEEQDASVTSLRSLLTQMALP